MYNVQIIVDPSQEEVETVMKHHQTLASAMDIDELKFGVVIDHFDCMFAQRRISLTTHSR